MQKWIFSAATLLMTVGLAVNTHAAIYPVEGLFTWVISDNTFWINTSAESNPYYGANTQITGTFNDETGQMLINDFEFAGAMTHFDIFDLSTNPNGTANGYSTAFGWNVNNFGPVNLLWNYYPGTVSTWAPGGATPVTLPNHLLPEDINDGNWMFTSMDSDGDGLAGTRLGAPFPGMNINLDFNIAGIDSVPEPGSMLLLGSGLAGLIGIARKRK